VREVLATKDLAFSELLQRDLEDHRVLNGLIPYLMGKSEIETSRIGFFPPLLAVVLPFRANTPTEFPRTLTKFIESEQGMHFESLEIPSYFKFSRTVERHDPNGDDSLENFKPVTSWRNAKLRWNSYNAKLVVIDGQHRAMAMLAIYRTLADGGKWEHGAARYKSFYLDELKRRYAGRKLPQIEIPVTICLFPGILNTKAPEASVHKIARNLFVDVNKEAKPPNPSRLILLSESSLTDMFTRALLDELRSMSTSRQDKTVLPLFGVEYDTPSGQRAMNEQRKTCVTNIDQLKLIVSIATRHRRYLKSLKEVPRKLGPGTDESLYDQLRLDLDDDDHFQSPDGQRFKKSGLKDDHFPSWSFDELRARFLQLHGDAIIRLLSEVQPYASVRDALIQFEENWAVVPDEVQTLAKESICDGVGTYWTIRLLTETWKERVKALPLDARREEERNKPKVVNAFELVSQKEAEYRRLLETKVSEIGITPELRSTSTVENTSSLLKKAETAAVQMGLVAAYAGLVIEFALNEQDSERFLALFISRLNDVSTSRSNKGLRRIFVFAEDSSGGPISQFYPFRSLEPRRWTHMRWIWLELFFSSAIPYSNELNALVTQDRLASARTRFVTDGRQALLQQAIDDFKKEIKTFTSSEQHQQESAFIKQLENSYLDWFDETVIFTATAEQVDANDNEVDDNDEENGDAAAD
jgi:hypothetical protein